VYEYKHARVEIHNGDFFNADITPLLNEHARDRWELVGMPQPMMQGPMVANGTPKCHWFVTFRRLLREDVVGSRTLEEPRESRVLLEG